MLGAIDTSNPANFFIFILSALLILAIVIGVHEAAHAFVANRLGDPTARLLGRMTLNPFVHVDTIGTIVLPFIFLTFSIVTGGGLAIFGWGKPTPVNPMNLSHPRRDMALVSLAGPASNFLIAVALSLLFRLLKVGSTFDMIILAVIQLNLWLMLFNLIPIPPLDGYKVVLGLLPKNLALKFSMIESYGPIILLIFIFFFFQIFSGFLFTILIYIMQFLTGLS